MNLIPWRNKREGGESEPAADHPLARLRSEMDQLFERFWREPFGLGMNDLWPRMSALGPRINMAESDQDITVTAELPGVDPGDVDISVSGDVLTIRGEKKQEKEDRKRDYHCVERSYGRFQRSIRLPGSADPDKVDATFRNGVLTLTLQKRPDAKPRRIAVKSE